jgi:2-haloacid dehalogenase
LNIKTIVFDLGGVYFTRGSYLAIEKLANIYQIKNKKNVWEFFSDGYEQEGQLIRLGLITMDEFEKEFIKKFDIEESKLVHIRNIWFGSYVPHYGIHDLVVKLSKNYRLVIFSGNIRERIEFLNDRYDFLDHFDDYVFSFDYNVNKSDIQFYEVLLNHIDCKPSEALLIDDDKKNIEISKSLGMHGIQYYYTEHLIGQLKEFEILI